jgi:succinate-acetate transporter protein
VLRVEALVELVLAVSAYRAFGGGWLMFAALVLLPDLGIAGYLMNRRVGAAVYNLAHTYSAPALLALAGLMLSTSALYLPALIWAAHIGFDRVLGYGLKYPVAFGATHLGWTGAPAAFAEQPSEAPLFN